MLDWKHLTHFLYLALGLLVSLLSAYYLRFSPSGQFFSLAFGVVYYILWGVTHHYFEGRLSSSIILEYILIGSFIILMFALMVGIV
ncbi:MAG: hypothetical protein AAB443_00110 [Patescibacteria group bacterium]